MEKKSSFHYAWVILLALCVIRSLSAAGINNTGGLFLKPVADGLGIGVGKLSVFFSVSSVASLVFMPFGGTLINRMKAKPLISAAIILQAGSFMLLGAMDSVWAWYLLSIPMGIGGAVLVNLLGPIMINRWFSKNTGTALGILMACVGLFGIVIQPVTSRLIAGRGWRLSYIMLGFFVLAVVLITNFIFIKDSPAGLKVRPYGAEEKEGGLGEEDLKEEKRDRLPGISHQQARKSGSFYLLLLFMVAITAFGAFNQHMATYGAELGYSPDRVGKVLSLGMVGSTLGAVLIGAVSDRIGAFKTTVCILAVIAASIVCLAFGGRSVWFFNIGSFFMGLGGMGIPVLSPLLTRDFFGQRDYEIIYSNVMMGPPLATVLLLPLYGYIYDIFGSYRLVFLILLFITAAGAVCIWAGYRMKPASENENQRT